MEAFRQTNCGRGNNMDAVLRELIVEDAHALARLCGQWRSQPQVEEFVADVSTADLAAKFIVEHARPDSRLVGIWMASELAGLVWLNLAGKHVATLDYLLGRPHRGQGLVTRACATVLDYVFTGLQRHRCEIQIDCVNVRSCAVAERLGFRKEGTRRHAAWYGGWYGDIAVYGLLADEWNSTAERVEWTSRAPSA